MIPLFSYFNVKYLLNGISLHISFLQCTFLPFKMLNILKNTLILCYMHQKLLWVHKKVWFVMAIKFKLLHKIVKGRHTFFLRGRYLGTDRALKLKTLYLHVQIGSGAKIIFFVYFFRLSKYNTWRKKEWKSSWYQNFDYLNVTLFFSLITRTRHCILCFIFILI